MEMQSSLVNIDSRTRKRSSVNLLFPARSVFGISMIVECTCSNRRAEGDEELADI